VCPQRFYVERRVLCAPERDRTLRMDQGGCGRLGSHPNGGRKRFSSGSAVDVYQVAGAQPLTHALNFSEFDRAHRSAQNGLFVVGLEPEPHTHTHPHALGQEKELRVPARREGGGIRPGFPLGAIPLAWA